MMQLATDAVRVRAHGRTVGSLYAQGATWVSFRPTAGSPCRIDFQLRQLPGMGLLSGLAQGVQHQHLKQEIREDNDEFSLHMNLTGRSVVSGGGREFTLEGGDGVLLHYSRSRTITRPGPVYHRVVRLPRKLLAPLVPHIDDAVLHPIRSGTGALELLANYVGALIHDPALANPAMRQLAATHLCDLLAITLGATRDAAAVAEGRGVRAARLRAIKADIEKHLIVSDLSPGAVAGRQQVSESYIRKLFEGEGTSFSAFVLGRRLVRAHRMLTDQRLVSQSIASIAFEAGFGDLSYFNRTFRRLYGLRPSDIRNGA